MQDHIFTKIDFTKDPLEKGEYEQCTFTHCDFSGSDLGSVQFFDCKFVGCNLSMATLVKTTFSDAEFKDCKMLGLRFEYCSEFGLSFGFENCTLDHSTFYKTLLKKTLFKNSQLHEVDFTECDLTSSTFEGCDLTKAIFVNTILEKVDFRSSYHYSFDPDLNKIGKAKFSLSGIAGLLDKYNIEIEKDF